MLKKLILIILSVYDSHDLSKCMKNISFFFFKVVLINSVMAVFAADLVYFNVVILLFYTCHYLRIYMYKCTAYTYHIHRTLCDFNNLLLL